MDKKLEERLRYSQANPEDHGTRIQVTLSLLRAGRAREARGLLDSVVEFLDSSLAWNPFAKNSRTIDHCLDIPTSLLDLTAIVSTSVDDHPVPFYEAASKGGHSDLALDALESILREGSSLSNIDLTRLLTSTMRRRHLPGGELIHEYLGALTQDETAALPSYVRLAWAGLASEFCLETAPFEKDSLQGVKKLVHFPKELRAQYPCPYFPSDDFPPIERQPSRQFGAHGGDYEFGPVLSLKMRLDHRFLLFDHQLLTLMKHEMSELADSFDLPPFEYCVFAEGYGFAWSDSMRPPEENAKALADVLNAWQLFPGHFEYVGRRPFDIIVDDALLVRRFRRDLMSHQGRSTKSSDGPFWSSPAMDLLKRVGPGRVSDIPACEDLLEQGRKLYASPGAEAMEVFFNSLFKRKKIVIPFSED